MATYLVTGVAGFIASKVAEQLLEAGHTVVGVDNLNDYYDVRLKLYRLGNLARQAGIPEAEVARCGLSVDSWKNQNFQVSGFRSQVSLKSARFTFHTLDIEDLPALERVFQGADFSAVFNLAARAGVRYSMENPHVYLSTNTLGTLNILECMRKHGVRKQVLASTSSLYAGCPMPFNEEQPVNTPLSPYAATKKAAEMLAHSYYKLYGLDTTVVRYFTVFGPAGRPDMSIFRFIKWIDEGKPLELLGDGTQSRDFTYVDDIARGTILAGKLFGGQMSDVSRQPSEISGLRSQVSGFSAGQEPGFEVINLGGGNNPITLQTVIKFIEGALGKKANIDEQAVAPADIKASWADIAKAKRLLGWEPQVSTEEGFRKSIAWYRANRSWLADVRL